MKKKKMIITMLFLFFISSIGAYAQSEKFKALFLYNFIKNIEWPQTYKQGDLVIGVLGNNPIVKELETITGSQKAGNQSMKVKVFANAEEVVSCHVIYIPSNKSGSVSQVLAKTSGTPTLIVSDGRGSIQQGAAINFFLDGDKLKFEISKSHIEQKGLKVSASLLNLGTSVN